MNYKYLIYLLIILIILNFLKKKLKKYIKIYKNNGFDGIWFYFINKNFKKTGLSNFIDKKKIYLEKKLKKFLKIEFFMGLILVQ